MKSSIEIARISLISSPRGPACCNCFISWNQTARIGPTSVATHGNLNRFYYTNIHKVILYDIVYLVGGIPTSLKKMSQLGWLLNIPNRWKNKKVFQTMYIYIYINYTHHTYTYLRIISPCLPDIQQCSAVDATELCFYPHPPNALRGVRWRKNWYHLAIYRTIFYGKYSIDFEDLPINNAYFPVRKLFL